MFIPKWWGDDRPYKIGDILDIVDDIPDKSIQCIVTSPPYWGQRSYTNSDKEIGKEATPYDYVNHIADVAYAMHYILRDDGVFFLNIGDSYIGGGRAGKEGIQKWGGLESDRSGMRYGMPTGKIEGLQKGDMAGVPWRVALALQNIGWILRSDIIWKKTSAMPSSQRNRPTSSYEHIFMFTKKNKYYMDFFNLREKGIYPSGTIAAKGSEARHEEPLVNARPPEYKVYDGMRTMRDVWEMTPARYGKHLAVFPEELPRRCISMATPEFGCCSECGAPYKRDIITERTARSDIGRTCNHVEQRMGKTPVPESGWQTFKRPGPWEAQCDCNSTPRPSIVFDPFVGSGTTIAVAYMLGRAGLGIELDERCRNLIEERIAAFNATLDTFSGGK